MGVKLKSIKSEEVQRTVDGIPNGWKQVKIEELTPRNKRYSIVDGPFGSNLKTEHYRKSGIPIITSGYVTTGKFVANEYLYVDHDKFKQEIRSAVKGGDIVMAKIGERCGSSAILPSDHQEGILSGNALKISINEINYSTNFVSHILLYLYRNGILDSLRTVGAQPAISMSNLKKFKIRLPESKSEQIAIGTALSDTDELITSLKKLIAKKRDIKQGAMQKFLKPKKEWKIEYLQNLVSITTGTKNTQDKIEGGKYPFFVRSQTVERINSYSFDGEAILTAGDGVGTGKVFHYINAKFDFHQRVYKLSDFRDDINGYYLFIYFSNNFYNRIMQMTAKSSVDSVRMEMIAKMPIPIPDKVEQSFIANALTDMEEEISFLKEKLIKFQTIKVGMMQSLLTGKIRLV